MSKTLVQTAKRIESIESEVDTLYAKLFKFQSVLKRHITPTQRTHIDKELRELRSQIQELQVSQSTLSAFLDARAIIIAHEVSSGKKSKEFTEFKEHQLEQIQELEQKYQARKKQILSIAQDVLRNPKDVKQLLSRLRIKDQGDQSGHTKESLKTGAAVKGALSFAVQHMGITISAAQAMGFLDYEFEKLINILNGEMIESRYRPAFFFKFLQEPELARFITSNKEVILDILNTSAFPLLTSIALADLSATDSINQKIKVFRDRIVSADTIVSMKKYGLNAQFLDTHLRPVVMAFFEHATSNTQLIQDIWKKTSTALKTRSPTDRDALIQRVFKDDVSIKSFLQADAVVDMLTSNPEQWAKSLLVLIQNTHTLKAIQEGYDVTDTTISALASSTTKIFASALKNTDDSTIKEIVHALFIERKSTVDVVMKATKTLISKGSLIRDVSNAFNDFIQKPSILLELGKIGSSILNSPKIIDKAKELGISQESLTSLSASMIEFTPKALQILNKCMQGFAQEPGAVSELCTQFQDIVNSANEERASKVQKLVHSILDLKAKNPTISQAMDNDLPSLLSKHASVLGKCIDEFLTSKIGQGLKAKSEKVLLALSKKLPLIAEIAELHRQKKYVQIVPKICKLLFDREVLALVINVAVDAVRYKYKTQSTRIKNAIDSVHLKDKISSIAHSVKQYVSSTKTTATTRTAPQQLSTHRR